MTDSGAYRIVTAEAAEKSVPPTREERPFDDLYRSQYARMVTLARLMTGAMSVAEEIVQDAFVQVYGNWSSIEFPVTYLRIAVVHGSQSHGRRRALARRHPERAPEPVVFDGVAIAVRDALLLLTPRQRAAVVLRYFDDLPEREIADVLGCRPGTVKSLLARSITKLKGSLDD